MTAFERTPRPTLFAATARQKRWRALRCGSAYVVADADGHEVMTLTRDGLGHAYAHAVDDRYTAIAIEISRAEIAFERIEAAGDVARGPEADGDYDANAAAEELEAER